MSPKTIIGYTLSLAAIAGASIFFPYYSQRSREYPNPERLDAALERKSNSGGLTPCQGDSDHYFEFAEKLFPQAPQGTAIYILMIPSFSPPEGIAITRTTVQHNRFQQTPIPPDPNPPIVTSISKLNQNLAFRIDDVVTRELRYASTMRKEGMDGETFLFIKPRVSCAYTWSPDSGRAAELSKLYGALANMNQYSGARVTDILDTIEAQELR